MKNIFLIALTFTLITLSFAAQSAYAETGGGCDKATGAGCNSTSVNLQNPFKAVCNNGNCGIVDLLQAIVDNIILPIGGVLAVLGFIWSGFMYVMARGNPTEIKNATTALTYTAIGTALLLGAYGISGVIKGTLDQFGTLK